MPEDVIPNDTNSDEVVISNDSVIEEAVADKDVTTAVIQDNTNPDEEWLKLDRDPVFLGKPTKVKRAEATEYIQKGMNYDHIKGKYETAESELAKLKADFAARDLADQRRQMEQQLQDEGYADPQTILGMIDNHPLIKKAEQIVKEAEIKQADIKRQEFIAEQKKSLESKPYYKELAGEIDNLIRGNPQSDVITAYHFLLGRMMDTGEIETLKKTANKAAAADLQDKLKRGTVMVSDGDSAKHELTEQEFDAMSQQERMKRWKDVKKLFNMK